jgi:hypothetical protein
MSSKEYKCEFCGDFSSTKSSLERHQKIKMKCIEIQKTMGLQVKDPVVKCQYCDKDFNIVSIKAHTELCLKKDSSYSRIQNNNYNNYNIHVHIEEIKDEINEDEEDVKEQNYIYCLMEREFLKSKESIYKIGKTNNIFKRFKQYPKGSKLIAFSEVKDCNKAEKDLITLLDSKLTRAPEIGREYYNCDVKILLKLFYEIALDNL